MINLDDYSIFENTDSIMNLSKDTSDKKDIKYMSNSDFIAIDFDNVKEIYVKEHVESSQAQIKSVDAVFMKDDKIVFVEFKNGNMNKEKRNVKEKIKDSLLVFGDITSTTISYAREKYDFILVYNSHKNPISTSSIGKSISKKSKKNFIRFGLEPFKGLYFNEVYTFSEEEFKAYIDDM